MAEANPQTATNGSVRVPFDQRDGATSDVFFTRDLSPEGLRRGCQSSPTAYRQDRHQAAHW